MTDATTANPAATNPALVAAFARAWVGTPHHPAAAARGIGADCVGLVAGVVFELAGRRHDLAGWRDDWRAGGDKIARALSGAMVPLPKAAARPGTICAFRDRAGRLVHVGIQTGAGLVHAADYAGRVVCDGWADGAMLSSVWGVPLGEGCETGTAADDLSDVVAVIHRDPPWTRAGVRADVFDRAGRRLARTRVWPGRFAALDALSGIFPHIETVD